MSIKQYTSAQVAEMLGYSRSMILLICQEKNLPRVGKQYVLGEEEIAIIKSSLGHKPTGRPKKTNTCYSMINNKAKKETESNAL